MKMTNLQVSLFKRDFSAALVLPVMPRVVSYSHAAIGGPKLAALEVVGDKKVLLSYLDRLRTPIEITDERGQKVWWGYIAEVRIKSGAVDIGVALDTMYNKVWVAYSLVEPGSQTVGTRATTTAATDQISIDEYGYKELLATLSGATTAQAEKVRDTLLAQRKYPIPSVAQAEEKGEDKVTLYCRGWWDTLGWRYYANANTGDVETTTQIAAIVTASGQFLLAADVEDASGISSSEYRDGDTTALAEVLDLLKSTSGGSRLLTQVTSARRVRVFVEPLVTAFKYILKRDGTLTTKTGAKVESYLCPVGAWVRVQDVVDYDLGLIADPSYFFIEEAEYSVASDKLRLQPRGIPSTWDVLTQLRGAE